MIERRVKGILNPPSKESMAALEFCVEASDRYLVKGVSKESKYMSKTNFDILVREKEILEVDVAYTENLKSPVAFWIGHAFRAKNNSLGCPELPSEGRHNSENGDFSIESQLYVNNFLELWLHGAAYVALTQDSLDVAILMNNADSKSEYSQVAEYFTSEDQEAYLSWGLRLARNDGNVMDEEELLNHYYSVRREILKESVRIEKPGVL
jgi:hypothetical protein